MIAASGEAVLLAARLGFVVGYGSVAGCAAFAVLWLLRRAGLRGQRPDAWRRDAVLAIVTAVAAALVNWFARPWPDALPSLAPATRTCRAIATVDAWTFEQPGDAIAGDGVLWVEVDVPVQVLLQLAPGVTSSRCFAIPAMRVHRDITPRQQEAVWFVPTELGDYPIEPSPGCPAAAGSPRGVVRVVDCATWSRAPWR